ncbi:OLC1v1008607C1 [Oldenlandia corymbosa var. corymbosa]|uniref:OLC1v1008607C1 n=1 Tax=Oldenlandia corymbosa var. corymbosa TaxID=529605 RepID=A0AAV1DNI0_OLDCO|nr:OLC1v1008607C1 [Oldenlandia corymbosa var. corymbosa]
MTIEMPKGLPFSVDTWSPNSKKKRHHFLTHAHKDHSQGILSHASFPIYCTILTKTLVLNSYPQLDEGLFIGIEVGQTLVINDPYGDFVVSAFDANHCPGAVMFLFEGSFGSILHTGDCRLTPACLLSLPEKYLGKEGKSPKCQLDYIFLDCTFGRSPLRMPSRQLAVQQVINCIWKHLDAPRVYLTCDLLGQEDILVEVSKTFGSKIYVDKVKNPEYFQALEFIVPDILTQDSSSRFHLFDGFPQLNERAEAKIAEARANFLQDPLIIRPSAQWYACENGFFEGENRRKGKCDQAIRDTSSIWHVCYSIHSSREELEWALQLLVPKWVISTTPSCRAIKLDYVKKHCLKSGATSDNSLWKLMDINSEQASAPKVSVECSCRSSPLKTAVANDLKPLTQSITQSTRQVKFFELSPTSRKSSITLFGKARIHTQGSAHDLEKKLLLKEDANSLQKELKVASSSVVETIEGECMKTSEEEVVKQETEFYKSRERGKPTYDSSVRSPNKSYNDSLRTFYRSMNVSVPQPLPSLVDLMKASKRKFLI